MTAVLSRRGVLGAGAVAMGVGIAASGTMTASASSATAAPASVAPTVAAPAETSAPSLDPERPVRSLFAGKEGTVYTGSSAWSAHRLTLQEVGDIPRDGDAENRFFVRFTADGAARDGIYRLTVDDALVAVLFLARVGSEGHLEGIVDRSEVGA